jgi:hypothetical protein
MSVNPIDTLIETFSELKRLHELNAELLDELCVAVDWVFEHEPQVPNAETLHSLLQKSRTLISEIQADEPKMLQYKMSRRKVTDYRERNGTDEEVPEPFFIRLLYWVMGSWLLQEIH